MSPRVAVASKLRRSRFDLHFAGQWMKTKVAAPDRQASPLPMREDLNLCAVSGMMPAVRTIHPTVQAPTQTVDAQLLIALIKTRKPDLTSIGATIAGGVFQVQDLWGCCDQHTASPG